MSAPVITLIGGKACAMAASRLFMTLADAQRLGTPAEGLAPWQSTTIAPLRGRGPHTRSDVLPSFPPVIS
jgi:hypothetical protein